MLKEQQKALRTSNVQCLLPITYKFTLFSNQHPCASITILFKYLMNLHYSQTLPQENTVRLPFKYLMNLHYSQTLPQENTVRLPFKYLMNLHYSQTIDNGFVRSLSFKYLMNLHYSQTQSDDTSSNSSLNTL